MLRETRQGRLRVGPTDTNRDWAVDGVTLILGETGQGVTLTLGETGQGSP